jgi:hypothetical protein
MAAAKTEKGRRLVGFSDEAAATCENLKSGIKQVTEHGKEWRKSNSD